MQLHIAAIGRVKNSPEAGLIDDYAARLAKLGRPLSLGPLKINEQDNRKHKGAAREAELLRQAIPDGSFLVAMDERGAQLSSPGFAKKLEDWRDDGNRDCTFLIGGADGIAPDLVKDAGFVLSFGKMVWPHMLARVMLAEQLYRAVSISAGQPYHRD